MPATQPHRFVGQNIKGTPSMSAVKVAADVRKVMSLADVAVLQEFKWSWYWRVLGSVATLRGWSANPALTRGLAHPIRGAQAVVHRRNLYDAVSTRTLLLHDGVAGVSDDRWLRGSLLRDRVHGLCCEFATTHFVVGGDMPTDPELRRSMLSSDLNRLAQFIDGRNPSWPLVMELDANVHVGSTAYMKLRKMIEQRGGTFHGQLGVEYLFTIPGRRAVVRVLRDWTIPLTELNTDHEGRGITYRIVSAPATVTAPPPGQENP